MPSVVDYSLPLADTQVPADQGELAECVRRAAATGTPLYPLGGRTALSFGTVAKTAGRGLSTERLTRIVDYPARDMTITVEAGLTAAELARTLAAEGQFLPVEIARPDRATVGGAAAVNFSGPRRFGYGTLRDYLIGISAVDGTGTPFKAGGRVVKNVAGYDFCKLLTGSLGTLAVITQLTFKVRPLPAAAAWLSTDLTTPAAAEPLLEALVRTRTTPTAVELVAGPAVAELPGLDAPASSKPVRLLIRLEGTHIETRWMVDQLRGEQRGLGVAESRVVEGADVDALDRRLIEFGCGDAPRRTVLKFNVRPSRVTQIVEVVRRAFANASITARAGSGVVLAELDDVATHELAAPLIRELQPAASAAGGRVVVWSSPAPEELTRQMAWGSSREDHGVLAAVKRQFDPHDVLNRGRFVF